MKRKGRDGRQWLCCCRRFGAALKIKVYWGKDPALVPGPGVIFFPYLKNMLNCGLAGIVAFKIEEWYDNLINRILPELVTERFHNLVIRLGTEKDDLLYNVSYVLVIFIGVLYVVLFKIF